VRGWFPIWFPDDGKVIGNDIGTAEFAWPVGMPPCRSIRERKGPWEIRSNPSDGRIARVLFCVHEGSMVPLHGFIKKSRKTPVRELDVAEKRMRGLP